MRVEATEPKWLESIDEAWKQASALGRAVVVRPLGQGYDRDDNW